jgi:solute carrier family 32 (vesicular inhibitory amino acid transporter)
MRITSLRHAGGVNSIDNFARSWQRAAGFHEITPVRRSSVVVNDVGEADSAERGDEEAVRPSKSLLGQQFESAGGYGAVECAIQEQQGDDPGRREGSRPVDGKLSDDANADIFSYTAHLASPLGRSFGTSYGTLSSRINESSRRHAARLFQEQQLTGAQGPDKEREPLLVKQVANEDGTLTNVIVGQSTLPQTVFNSVNTLIGVGLLSLPLGIKYAGWVVGLLFLCSSAIVTSYTAKLLTICLDTDPSLITYADLAYVSFGPNARIVTGFLFSFELIAACVALVVLFADSLDALIPGWGVIEWKMVCGILLIPLNFAPLRLLSFSSILGILCCTMLVGIVVIDGIIKPQTPGSLREPATTYLFPEHWSTLPLSFGLLMSPWGGHSVFPSIYRDMRHPQKYGKSLRYTFSFTFGLDLAMAVVGLLMFGDYIRDEVTSNILLTEGYPQFLSIIIVVLIAIIPITKIPLRYARLNHYNTLANEVPVVAQSSAPWRYSVVSILVFCHPNLASKACQHSLVAFSKYLYGYWWSF